MHDLVEYIAKALVDQPEAVEVRTVEGDRSILCELKVSPDDIGKVIGRQGRIARAIRAIAKTAGSRTGKLIHVEIIE